jgi:sugar/nucleoside kinase (ribokinase family)
VTLGERGMIWREKDDGMQALPALHVPSERVVDTNGAGDLFHGAYVFSQMHWPERSWNLHFRFARAASAHGVQHLGNEARLPRIDDVIATANSFGDPLKP